MSVLVRGIFGIIILLICFSSAAQTLKERQKVEDEMMKVIKSQDTISRSVFLDSTFLSKHKLKVFGAWNVNQISRKSDMKDSGIVDFHDLRLRFNSNNEALSFHQKFLPANSEYAKETNLDFEIEGAELMYTFLNNPIYDSFLVENNLKMYFILFVVDNYMVKQFFTCKADVNPEILGKFAREAVLRIRNSGKSPITEP